MTAESCRKQDNFPCPSGSFRFSEKENHDMNPCSKMIAPVSESPKIFFITGEPDLSAEIGRCQHKSVGQRQISMSNLSVISEISVLYKNPVKYREMKQISSSGDAVNLLRSVWSDQMQYREEFVILLLNRANRVLGFTLISKGGTSGTVVDTKMIFQIALKANASGLILSHNHPSGNTAPSEADISLTRKVISGGKLLEISVLDHIILTDESQYSFADNGLMPFE